MAIKTHCPDPYPSYETIMKYTGLARDTVNKAIKELEVRGYISVVRKRGKPNRYDMRYFPDGGGFGRPKAKVAPVHPVNYTSSPHELLPVHPVNSNYTKNYTKELYAKVLSGIAEHNQKEKNK